MYQDKKICAIIPARGGSKGIKNKNIIDICGKPLIAYTIEAALNSRYIDRTIVSTDSEQIASVAAAHGADVPFLRPPALASDTSKTIDGILYTIRELEKRGEYYDILILLQPTSPLRDYADIDHAVKTFFENNFVSLVSVSPVTDSPILIRTINPDGTVHKLLAGNSTVRRQDMPDYYIVNGGIYINHVRDLCETTSFNDNEGSYIMASEHSIDIDDYSDIALVEYYLSQSIS